MVPKIKGFGIRKLRFISFIYKKLYDLDQVALFSVLSFPSFHIEIIKYLLHRFVVKLNYIICI